MVLLAHPRRCGHELNNQTRRACAARLGNQIIAERNNVKRAAVSISVVLALVLGTALPAVASPPRHQSASTSAPPSTSLGRPPSWVTPEAIARRASPTT